MNREQKIQFLKDLEAGKAALKPETDLSDLPVWMIDADGGATDLKTQERLTKEELENRHKGIHTIVFE